MLTKMANRIKATLSQVKIGDQWREVNVGWIKNAGVWSRFKYTYIAQDIAVRLGAAQGQNADGTTYTRKSMIRTSATATGFQQGRIAQTGFVINGETRQIRGIETGSDSVGGQPAWKWVSVQFFGNVDIKYLARTLKFNGLTGINVDASYNSSVDITFMTFAWPEGSEPTTTADLKITF